MLMYDGRIKYLAENEKMIHPFVDHQVSDGVISYGLSSYGYDMRLSKDVDVFMEYVSSEMFSIDPKNKVKQYGRFWETHAHDEYFDILPGQLVLAKSLERFRIPRNTLGIVNGKSTYARCGLIVNVTPIEPEWEGHITLNLINTTGRPLRVYVNEGIAQIMFLYGNTCDISYADRKGKYQNADGIQKALIG